MEEKESKKYIKYTSDPVELELDMIKVLDALSKATPMKPSIEKTNACTVYRCPVCSNWFDTVMIRPPRKPTYCWDCGQKLDWTEVK